MTDPGAGPRVPGPGWFADPLGPRGHLRWWDGRAWTARIVPDGADGEAISWSPTLRTLAAPEAAPGAEAPIRVSARTPRPLIDAPTDATPLASLAMAHADSERTVVDAPPISFHAVGVAPPLPDTASLPDTPPGLHPLDVGVDDALAPAPPAPRSSPWPDLAPVELVDEPSGPVDPLRAAFGDDAVWVDDVDAARSAGRARRRLVPALVAAAVVALAAGAGAGIVTGGDRPSVEPAVEYRDPSAGFSLRYPDTWTVERETPGESVQLAIADPGASSLHTNLVTVRVGAEPADGQADSLPSLDELSTEVTTRLREEYPGIELEEAARTRLADAPALRLQLVDADAVPPIRIQQYAGRTTTGRPLTVSITVREPRTAPTPQQLRDFIASIAPA